MFCTKDACYYVSLNIIIVVIFNPYGLLFYTLLSESLLHISSQCCYTPVVYKIRSNQRHLLVQVNLIPEAHGHKSIDPYPTMSYYQVIYLFHNAA